VHMAHAGHPILCDKLYGGRSQITAAELSGAAATGEPLLARQALHAHRLVIAHPATGESLQFEAPVPADMQAVLDCLRSRQ
ncbi:MAG: RluA family pseudouridine synthase, partial [Planctomycetota bacterium]